MKCRKSVAELTAAERAGYVQAVLDLKDPTKSPSRIPAAQIAVTNGGGQPNRYDDFVYLHNVVGLGLTAARPSGHGTGSSCANSSTTCSRSAGTRS